MRIFWSVLLFGFACNNFADIPRRVLVKVAEGVPDAARETAAVLGALEVETFSIVPHLSLFELDDITEINDALDEFRNTPGVIYAEEDSLVNAFAPNDPRFPELWALENTGQTGGTPDADINARAMWQLEDGSTNVVVAVLDSGVEYTHPDLSANMWRNGLEIAGNSIDDDGNGYVDDIYGINAITNSGNPRDDNAHGTHVAGTIAADGNNGRGVVGVAPDVKIIACKFLRADGSGTISDAIQCLQYLGALKTRTNNPVNLVATNNSWGSNSSSNALRDGILAHQNLGILFVAAAGNASQNNDAFGSYPANYELANVISVAATDHSDNLASFSNYGLRSVHTAAPGVKILSTVLNGGYSFFSGTSMATPHVTGLVAIAKSRFPSYDFKKIKNLVISSGTPIASLRSKIISGRRIRGAHNNGTGALTCSNQLVKARLQPRTASMNIELGSSIFLSALNVNCSNPFGAIQVYSDQNETVILDDKGMNGDMIANDGIASLSWKPQKVGSYTLDFGNSDRVTVSVFTTAPTLRYQASSVPYQYESIVGTSLNARFGSIHTVTSPFPILWNGGVGFDRLYVTPNGTISFSTSTNPGAVNRSLPYYQLTNLVAPYWDDLFPPVDPSANVFIETLGSSPNRKFIIEWRNLRASGALGTGTFQTVFYENSSDIRFNYLDTNFDTGTSDFGISATSGLQIDASTATQFSYNTPTLLSETSVLYRLQ